ncbi:MAG: hypothetical protein HQM12_18020 [SAR324 cluster bacterium]|nr:hypothetical protein [SAR324 cluster bacterium]
MNTISKTFQVFDPNPSLRFALELLLQSGISGFALIGKLAMWVYLDDESQHEYTKDVDFAIKTGEISKLEQEISRRNLHCQNLQIGGIGIRETGLSIDFIDRRLHGVAPLFADAIESAVMRVTVDEQSIPVVSLEHLVAMKIVSGEPKDDHDLRKLIALQALNYPLARKIVDTYLGPIVAERLDVFAREANILPRRGPYNYGE